MKQFNFVPSSEQQLIVNAVAAGKNVIVDAVAGSGKTTTVLAIAKACPTKSIYQITFNSQLKCEVREKVVLSNLTNVQVHTYHSLATTFYDKTAYTDAKIISVLTEGAKLKKKAQVDIIIVDEAQDMTILYFKLVNKFMHDVGGSGCQLVILGDRFQGVYDFMQADTRFLTHAADIWSSEFVHLNLKESYRVTNQVAWFVNNLMIGHQRIVSKKESNVKVEWYICNVFDTEGPFMNEMVANLKKGKINPEDIFVLAASLKGMSPAKKIENILVKNKIPVYVPISDDKKMDEDVTRGKVVFATLPSSKGRERPIVILLGFDENYFDFYAKSSDRDVCPSTLYVAATRAKERLICVSEVKVKALPFISTKMIGTQEFKKNVSYVNDGFLLKTKSNEKTRSNERRTSVIDLVKYLKPESIEYLTPLVNDIFDIEMPPSEVPINIASKIRMGGVDMFEDVSHLNGMAIPAMWETRIVAAANNDAGGISTVSTMHNLVVHQKQQTSFIQKAIKKIKNPCVEAADFLYVANVYWGMTEGYHGQLAQIECYNWLDQGNVEKCIQVLQSNVDTTNIEFEVNIGSSVQTMFGSVCIRGAIDIVNDEHVWEVKCVDNLQIEHMLQLVVYYWLYMKSTIDAKSRRFKLINVRTGEIRALKTDDANAHHIENIVNCLLSQKYKTAEKLSDPDFIKECHKARQSWCLRL